VTVALLAFTCKGRHLSEPAIDIPRPFSIFEIHHSLLPGVGNYKFTDQDFEQEAAEIAKVSRAISR
jgi:hypothetical protein